MPAGVVSRRVRACKQLPTCQRMHLTEPKHLLPRAPTCASMAAHACRMLRPPFEAPTCRELLHMLIPVHTRMLCLRSIWKSVADAGHVPEAVTSMEAHAAPGLPGQKVSRLLIDSTLGGEGEDLVSLEETSPGRCTHAATPSFG
eukprot:354186-Chlamydomonas_euryale.AAC.8